MPASGQSSNRLYEYNRGYDGGGHGVYAEAGRRQREIDDAARSSKEPRRSEKRKRDFLKVPGRVLGAGHPTRFRVEITEYSTETGYGNIEWWSEVTVVKGGRSLTSMLPNGMHAPVLDVDHPVKVSPDDHGTRVTFTLDANPELLREALTKLVAERMVHPVTLDMLAGAPPARRWWRRLRGWVGQVDIVFPFPVAAVPSKRSNHFHLLVQKQMKWNQAKSLLSTLGIVNIVDPHYAAISGEGDFMYVNTPPSELDTI